VLAFAGYNAGRGRVNEWIVKYGDPRDPKVDPIDWVERIPFSETRNYVQRVLENLQIYRMRLGRGSKLSIEADLRRRARSN
jgi:soluble lytic murein transglycosylase